jgi:hypothetical protein
MELLYEQKRKYWEARHPGQHIQARDKIAVCCVLHGEKCPSCTLFLTGSGGFNCHACGAHGSLLQFEMAFSKCDIETALKNVAAITGAALNNSSGRRFVAAHTYFNLDGIPVSEKRRFELANGEKTFTWHYRDEAGRWRSGLESDTPRLLYNQHEVTTANLVLYTEGEKCVEAVKKLVPQLWPERQAKGLRIAVTTNPEGAWKPGAARWREEYNKSFSNKPVVFFEDNDLQGRTLAEHVSRQIHPYAASVRRKAFSDQREKYDVADWIAEHDPECVVADLEHMIETAALWKPQPGEQSEQTNWIVESVGWAETASPEVDWLIDGVIQADANGIIAAEPKTGKSLAALDLLLSLACGQRWLGRAVKRRVRSAYISREDSPLLTKARIAGFLRGKGIDAGVDPTGWLWCNTREQLADFNIDNDEHLRHMAHDLKEHGVEFAMLDVFNRLHSRNENDNTEMAAVVARISQMGREAGCSLGVVHHVSKENGSSGRFFTRIRGASAIHGWTEWSIGLSLENPNNEGKKLIRRAEFESKAGESAPLSFTVEFGGGNLRLQLLDPMAYDSPNREGRSRFQ